MGKSHRSLIQDDTTISSKNKVKSMRGKMHMNPFKSGKNSDKVSKLKKSDIDPLETSRGRQRANQIIRSVITSPLIPGSKQKKNKVAHEVHAPVAYSLSIHAPFIVENLLCVPGRYELMHATRRQIVW